MEINETFDLTAPPEVVFNSLVDPARTDRWLPGGVRVGRDDGGQVRVSIGSTAATFAVETDPDDLELSWRSVDGGGVHGRVRAQDGPAGGTRLRVAVTAPDGADPDRGRRLVAEAVRHLQEDVSDNFNAG